MSIIGRKTSFARPEKLWHVHQASTQATSPLGILKILSRKPDEDTMAMNQFPALYQSRSFFIENTFITEHTPMSEPKGVFVLLHGFPAWVSKNYDAAEVLVLAGYKVYIPHHQGLGQSPGVFRFSENIKTTRLLLNAILGWHPTLKLSLLGHSWGGYLALRHVDLVTDRLILLAPLARFPEDDRRDTLTSSLYNHHTSDLSAYTLETMKEEFLQLERDLSYDRLLRHDTAPQSLLIYGTKDEVIPADLIESFAQRVQGPRFETLILNDDHRLSKRRPVLEKIRDWV